MSWWPSFVTFWVKPEAFDLGGLHIDIGLSTRWDATTLKGAEESAMHSQSNELQGSMYSPARIRATWDGTGSVADASKALGFSRAKGYDLVRRAEFPCRVLRVGRTTRVVTASLLRVLESGEPEYNGAHAGAPARDRRQLLTEAPQEQTCGALVARRSHPPITDCVGFPGPKCPDLVLRAHLGLA